MKKRIKNKDRYAERAKTFWYRLMLISLYSLFLIPCSFGQTNDSIYNATQIKLDIASPVVIAGTHQWQMQHYEIAANVQLARRFFPTLELGYSGGKTHRGDSIRYNAHGGFFRELTPEEANAYNTTGTIATPTPVPESNGTSPTPTPTPAPAGQGDLPAKAGSMGVVTAGGTNMREGPGTGYHSLMKLDRNTQVELLTIPSVRGGGSGTFFKVRYDGVTGYIMSDFISILSGGPESGESIAATPAPTPANSSSDSSSRTMVKLILSSCHLRTSPGGDYDPKNDWTGQGTTLPLAGSPVKQGGYTWYPVSKNGKTS